MRWKFVEICACVSAYILCSNAMQYISFYNYITEQFFFLYFISDFYIQKQMSLLLCVCVLSWVQENSFNSFFFVFTFCYTIVVISASSNVCDGYSQKKNMFWKCSLHVPPCLSLSFGLSSRLALRLMYYKKKNLFLFPEYVIISVTVNDLSISIFYTCAIACGAYIFHCYFL